MPFVYTITKLFTIEFWRFSRYSRHKAFVRYYIQLANPPQFCSLSFHLLCKIIHSTKFLIMEIY